MITPLVAWVVLLVAVVMWIFLSVRAIDRIYVVKSDMSSTVPKSVMHWCIIGEAWIIGSAADPEKRSPRDYDIVVPFHMWYKVAASIPKSARPNTLGGWKMISDDGVEVDIWPDDPMRIINRCAHIWDPVNNVRFTRKKGW